MVLVVPFRISAALKATRCQAASVERLICVQPVTLAGQTCSSVAGPMIGDCRMSSKRLLSICAIAMLPGEGMDSIVTDGVDSQQLMLLRRARAEAASI